MRFIEEVPPSILPSGFAAWTVSKNVSNGVEKVLGQVVPV
jgi:hypothetical protein